MEKGIIQVYTGNGKGKTTAAVGLAVRAAGQGLRVIFFQFLKAPLSSGEHFLLEDLSDNLKMVALGSGELIIGRKPSRIESEQATNGWRRIQEAIFSLDFDMVIIDELSHVLNLGLLNPDEVVHVLKTKPDNIEVIITGSNMPDFILETAALITEMKPVKHPYTNGLTSRRGIEY